MTKSLDDAKIQTEVKKIVKTLLGCQRHEIPLFGHFDACVSACKVVHIYTG